ncbi:MAG: hypothetical protein JO372_01180 [Solirubrobacterales bacterium]|nr:hypothetical protein [Solirubrobacterales bacterium]
MLDRRALWTLDAAHGGRSTLTRLSLGQALERLREALDRLDQILAVGLALER